MLQQPPQPSQKPLYIKSQLTRTYGESAINLSAAALLGGALGAGGKALANSLDASAIGGIVDSMDVEPKVKSGDDSVSCPLSTGRLHKRKAWARHSAWQTLR